MKKYLHIWILFLIRASEGALTSKLGASLFLVGKIIRFGSFLIFLLLLSSKITAIAGYTIWEIALFFLTFSLIDAVPQFLYREVYRFRDYIVKGDFDYFLAKPISPLFRSLFGGSDILDIPNLLLFILGIIIVLFHLSFSPVNLVLYILLCLNGIFIATAFHIIILSLCIITTEIDNAMMFYRDLTIMGRFPLDIYQEPIRSILTFVIPVGAMITVPVKSLLGLATIPVMIISLFIGIVIFILSILLWRYSLRFYSSASS